MHPARFPYLKPARGTQINRAHPLAKGLAGCWLFNEGSGLKVFDLSGNGNSGTLLNMEEADWTSGDDGYAIEFNGDDEVIRIEDNSSIDIDAEDFSIAIWIKPTNITGIEMLFAKGEDRDQKDYRLFIENEAILFDFEVSNGSEQRATSGNVLTTDWQFICATYSESTRQQRLYRDAVEIASNTAAYSPASSSFFMTIGAKWDGFAGEYNTEFTGKIKCAFFYKGVALLPNSINWLHRESYAMFQQNRVRWFSVTGGIAVFASISDDLGISDTVTTKTGYIRSAANNVGISDVLTRIATYIRSLAVNLATTDTINTSSNLKRSMAENVGITDTVTTKKFVLVALSDNLGIADVLTSEKFILVAIADNVGITDTLTTIGTFIRSIADGVGITDVVSRIGTFIRSESDNVGVTDTLTPTKGVSRTITDGVGITDVLSAIVGKLSSIVTTLGITDVLTFIRTTVAGGRVFIAGIAKSLRMLGRNKSLKISGSGD